MTGIADRTVVFAIGLERYDYGDGMDLPGAAAGAARFARWAMGCGVPAERVRLACSWLGDGRPPLGVHLVGTTQDALRAALLEALELGGDLLLLYWCGHGLLNEERQRVLFTSNATSADKVNIPVSEILRLLASATGLGFPRQVLLIDACANFLEDMRFDEGLPQMSFGWRGSREVEQYVLYSAEQGQLAEYDRIARRAAFSTEVLAWLESESPGTLPPDMAALRRHVGEFFQRRNEAGDHRQTPVALVVEPYSGDEEWIPYGGLPVTGRLQARTVGLGLTVSQVHRLADAVLACWALLDDDGARGRVAAAIRSGPEAPADRAQLSAAVAEEFAAGRGQDVVRTLRALAASEAQRLEVAAVEQCWLRQRRIAAAVQCFGPVTAQQVRMAYDRAVPRDDRRLVRDLEEAMEYAAGYVAAPDGVTPLTRLVVMLEHLTGATVRDEWFELGPQRLAGLRAQAERWLTVADARLVIDLHNGGMPSARLRWPDAVSGYLYRAGTGWSPLGPVSCARTLRGVRGAVLSLIDQVDRMEIADFTVGFILDRAAFAAAPEAWMQPQELADPIPLGELHPIVLHSGERLGVKRPRALWKDRVSAIRARLVHEAPDVCWIDEERRDDPPLIRRTVADTTAACIGLAFTPGEVRRELPADPILAAVAAGAPYVLWVDSEPADWAAIRRDIADIVARGPFDELPERIRRWRAARSGAVRVMWDDPQALPMTMLLGVSVEGTGHD